jgi:two-component system cell cycle response regulator CpdR
VPQKRARRKPGPRGSVQRFDAGPHCRRPNLPMEPTKSVFRLNPKRIRGLTHVLLMEIAMGQSKPFRQTAVVVEDDEIQRDMIVLLLEESDFQVIQCEDAETAWLAIKMRHPSFLITDINLSGKMDGVELARIAHRQSPNMRVVVISGQAPTSALPEGVRFLAKPFYPITLLREAAR